MKPAIVFLCLFLFLLRHSTAQNSCGRETFSSNKLYSTCNSLPYLSASLHWNHHPSNGTLDVAYRAQQSSTGWVAWGINPTGSGMIGANAFLAFPGSNGAVTVYTSKLKSFGVQIKNESLDFTVYSAEGEYTSGSYTIYATLKLPSNKTKLNTVWQASDQFQNGIPAGHSTTGDNVLSQTAITFLSGEAAAPTGEAAAPTGEAAVPTSQSSCGRETFSSNKLYSTCNSLPYLSASLHWNYHPSNGTLDVAYRAQQSSTGWVAWGINPTGSGMIGANAFLAFPGSNGAVTVYTSKLNSFGVQIKNESLDFTVYSAEGEYTSGSYTIYATLKLPSNKTKLNTVWQASDQIQNGIPAGHSTTGDNVLSQTAVDFLSGGTASTGGIPRLHRKNIHGVLNAISWGILMPIGAIIARYLKVFKSADPAWFYLHVACQCSAYIIGLSGWILGLKLGSESSGITYHKHRDIGIALFCLATVQVFALFLRPNKDNKYRIYWNVYHYAVGYSIIILSIVNVFEGFDILDPAKKWKHAYIGVIATLAGIALVLEAVTWPIVLKRRSRSSEKSHHGANGGNGYAVRQHEV